MNGWARAQDVRQSRTILHSARHGIGPMLLQAGSPTPSVSTIRRTSGHACRHPACQPGQNISKAFEAGRWKHVCELRAAHHVSIFSERLGTLLSAVVPCSQHPHWPTSVPAGRAKAAETLRQAGGGAGLPLVVAHHQSCQDSAAAAEMMALAMMAMVIAAGSAAATAARLAGDDALVPLVSEHRHAATVHPVRTTPHARPLSA